MGRIWRELLLAGLVLFGGSAFANEAQLILVAGEVTLQRAIAGQPTQTLVPANGTRVQAGDALITGATGRVQIRFSDGSLVSLQPRSEFRIDEYRFDMGQQRGFFSLVRGALRTISGAVGKRDPDDYRMTTPTATIGIRGTEFLVEETLCTPACHPGRTAGLRVSVSAGHVVVFNAAGSIEVPAGGATYVAGPASAPVPSSERPTMSTAPASFDPTNPANGIRLTGLTPGAGALGAVSPIDGAAGAGAPRQSAGTSSANQQPKVPGNGGATLAARARPLPLDRADGVPPAMLDQWSTRPGVTGSGSLPGQPEILASTASLASVAVAPATAPVPAANASGTVPPKAIRAEVPQVAVARAGEPNGTSAQAGAAAGSENDDDVPDDDDVLDDFAQAPPGTGFVPGPAIDFNRPAASATLPPATGGNGGGQAAPATDPIVTIALSASGDGTLTAPVNGSPGTNAQRDPVGVPIAIGSSGLCAGSSLCNPPATGGDSSGAGGSANTGGPDTGTGGTTGGGTGTGGGNGGDGGAGNGNTGGGDPGGNSGGGDTGGGDNGGGEDTGGGDDGDTGGGNGGGDDDHDDDGHGGGDPGGNSPPVLTPGLNTAGRIAVRTLQSPWLDRNVSASSAHVTLDSDFRLESIGLCPHSLCLSRGTAQVVEAGHNADLSWGRWVNGKARIALGLMYRDETLGSNDGIHYLVGVPTVSMPTSGSAYYAFAGATSPTFASGAVAPGVFSGQGLVQFGSGQATRVGFKGDMVFSSGERYHLFSNGARTDAAGRLVEIGDTQIRMIGRTTFRGNIGVVSQGNSDRLGCGGSNCQASVEGGFYGPAAARMGVGYSVGRANGDGDTINGVAVLNREQP